MTKRQAPSAQPVKDVPADVLQAINDQLRKGQTQAAVARELGVSPAVVNQALKGSFKGNVERFALRVRGKYLQSVVVCPVLGSIGTHVCLAEQAKPATFSNPQRVALKRACKTCPHRQGDSHVAAAN